ncbi:type II toxin-antitoxin system VapC family toxin [Pseudanabaena sp. ABRG5-3]|uniref:type II toxin-antitoxin system VapC family toxin n=1 Tax=Pseudanabaena sp. ABRG5-3 TaxID=685565 RepID=UPI000DC6FDDC|nr:PIN domain-containing protein [Pseudanabaena sp. ABRG5-3]BBC24120.1 PilT domain protein [Pseudanabaena sp. ABRG5-3]
MDTYLVDTHALAWFIAADKRLSALAEHILNQAQEGEVQILIPTLVLAELTHIAEKGKVKVSVEEILQQINRGDGFMVVAFDFSVFQAMLSLPKEWDIHDRVIAATASYYQTTLITRDEMLRESSKIKTLWD